MFLTELWKKQSLMKDVELSRKETALKEKEGTTTESDYKHA